MPFTGVGVQVPPSDTTAALFKAALGRRRFTRMRGSSRPSARAGSSSSALVAAGPGRGDAGRPRPRSSSRSRSSLPARSSRRSTRAHARRRSSTVLRPTGIRPVVTTVPAGTAHSGTRVAHFATCPGCEFSSRRARSGGSRRRPAGSKPTSATWRVSLNAAQATITMVARGTRAGRRWAPRSTTVTEGQPFTQLVGVTAAWLDDRVLRADHDSPTLGSQPVGFDDLAITIRPGASPRTSRSRPSAAPAPSGTSVDDPDRRAPAQRLERERGR